MGNDDLLKAEAFLCSFLRSENLSWPHDTAHTFAANLTLRARYHGVLPLMHDKLQRENKYAQSWPQEVLQACRKDAIEHAMWELRHQDLMGQVLSQLALNGIQPVLFKGTALAYSVYPSGALRIRGDTDLIIPPSELAQFTTILATLSFNTDVSMDGELVAYQTNFHRQELGSGAHTLDVHWRISNSELLSRLFSYQELRKRAQPIARLSQDALAVDIVDALLIACMHRGSHKQNPYYLDGVAYYDGDRLIWLYDIHLLLGKMSSSQFDEFVARATEKGLRAVCLEGIERARGYFHTQVPDEIMFALSHSGPQEPAARYLNGSHLLQTWMDFKALGNVYKQLQFLKETVFPPASYMRSKNPDAAFSFLPWLYLHRAVGGIRKRLQMWAK
jgi:Uncharacterised nucleotidyltransferase